MRECRPSKPSPLQPVSCQGTADRPDRKPLEDHLFWQAVDQATAHGLPVKLHTGYYAGENSMPLARLRLNAGSAAELCRLSPDTKFVFMHICYPYYEEMLALTKHYTNAYIDMCWSWIINPLAAKDYLKKHIVTAPVNKLLPFGGDYTPVEPVLGHAIIARRGITQALAELVEKAGSHSAMPWNWWSPSCAVTRTSSSAWIKRPKRWNVPIGTSGTNGRLAAARKANPKPNPPKSKSTAVGQNRFRLWRLSSRGPLLRTESAPHIHTTVAVLASRAPSGCGAQRGWLR